MTLLLADFNDDPEAIDAKEFEDPDVDMFPLFSSASSVTNLLPAFGVTYSTSPVFNLKLVIVEVLVNRISSPGRPFLSFLTIKSSSVFSKAFILALRSVPEVELAICNLFRPSEDRIPSVIWFRDIFDSAREFQVTDNDIDGSETKPILPLCDETFKDFSSFCPFSSNYTIHLQF